MARRPTIGQQRLFAELIAKLAPGLQASFIGAVEDMREGADFDAVLAALEIQNIEAAIAALNIEAASFYAYGSAKAGAFAQAGALTATTITAAGAGSIGVRFDMANPTAERWIREEVWGQINNWLVPEQVQAVRETILSGYQVGRHPHSIALDVVGRVTAGRRSGGVIGLDAERARRLTAVSRGMETAEGVQDLVIAHRNGTFSIRYRVNKATEARILRAYRRGEAVPAPDRAISIRQYENALLKSRADQLAQDATAEAVFGGRREEWSQTLAKLNLPPEAVLKTWRHGGGPEDPRPHHVAMNGKSVRGLDTAFVFSNGASLRFPHDPNGPVSETTKCTCGAEFRLDPAWGVQ